MRLLNQYKKGKMLSLPTKERKAKFNTDDLIFRKTFSLPSENLLSAESLTNKYKLFGTKSKQTVNFSNISKNPFSSTPSKIYI